jgi:FkbM family methyltransferase
MHRSIRRLFLGTPILGAVYCWARKRYHMYATAKEAKRYFINYDDYRRALQVEGNGTVDIRTADGLTITIRMNIWDARILQEVFLDNPYVRDSSLPPEPIIVDIGGYIGDFALYAVRQLGSRKVFVYEPSKKNFAIMTRNIEHNQYRDRIVAVNMAVSDANEVLMDIDLPDNKQLNVSVYTSDPSTATSVPCITLKDLFNAHELGCVDLLKLDCEGSEYAILLSAPMELFKRIRNIAMELHEIEGFEAKLRAVQTRLESAGYAIKIRGDILCASRDDLAPGHPIGKSG